MAIPGEACLMLKDSVLEPTRMPDSWRRFHTWKACSEEKGGSREVGAPRFEGLRSNSQPSGRQHNHKSL